MILDLTPLGSLQYYDPRPDPVGFQIPKAHRRAPAPTLAQIAKRAPDRNSDIKQAHATGAYSYQQIAEYFGLHFTTVGGIVRGSG